MSIVADEIAPVRLKPAATLIWLEKLCVISVLAGLGFLLIQAYQVLEALPSFADASGFRDVRADTALISAQLSVWSLLAPGLVGVLALITAARFSHPFVIFIGFAVLTLLALRFQTVGGWPALLNPDQALPALSFYSGTFGPAELTFQGAHFVVMSLLVMVVGLAVLYVIRSTWRLLSAALLAVVLILPIAAALIFDTPKDMAPVCGAVLVGLCALSLADRGGRALFVPFVMVATMAMLTVALTYFPVMTATTGILVTPDLFAKIAPIVDSFSLDSRLGRNLDLDRALSPPVALAGTYGISTLTAALGLFLTLVMARPGRFNFVLVWIATAAGLGAALVAATRSGWELLFGMFYTDIGWQGSRELTDTLLATPQITSTAGVLVLGGLLAAAALFYLISRARHGIST